MISLAKTNVASPDFYSSGDGTDPVSVSLTLDGSGGTVSGSPATSLFVWANDDTGTIGSYTGIGVSIVGSDTGITWTLSTDNITFTSTLSLSTMDVSLTYQATQIYCKATALNDGTVPTANYTTADIKITATSNPDV